jgi:hypothetical protein
MAGPPPPQSPPVPTSNRYTPIAPPAVLSRPASAAPEVAGSRNSALPRPPSARLSSPHRLLGKSQARHTSTAAAPMLQAELGAAPIKSSPPPVQPKLANLGVLPTVKIEPIVVQDLFMDTPQGKKTSDPTPKASQIWQNDTDSDSDSDSDSVGPNDGISALGIHPPIVSPTKSLLPELPVPEEYHFEGQVFDTLDKVIEASAKELKIDDTHVNWLRSMIEVIVMTNVNNVYNALRNKIYQHKDEVTVKNTPQEPSNFDIFSIFFSYFPR